MSKPTQPEVGNKAPDFKGLSDTIGEISLEQFKGKNIVLYFYPKDMTPGCTTEGIDFTALLPQFENANTVVIGVSKDSEARHQKFRDKHDLKILLLADEEGNTLEAYGAWGQKKLYGRTFLGIIRCTFLIDSNGVVRRVWPKVKVKGHAQEVLDAVKEL